MLAYPVPLEVHGSNTGNQTLAVPVNENWMRNHPFGYLVMMFEPLTTVPVVLPNAPFPLKSKKAPWIVAPCWTFTQIQFAPSAFANTDIV
jgi:hypothetical protein